MKTHHLLLKILALEASATDCAKGSPRLMLKSLAILLMSNHFQSQNGIPNIVTPIKYMIAIE
jgi:hypothetical protein